MAAYIIFDRRNTTNAAELATYGSMVATTLKGREAVTVPLLQEVLLIQAVALPAARTRSK